METNLKDIITILQYLLPGFVSAWIFYSFTSYPKPSQFERVVQALIFTIFVQVLVYLTYAVFGIIEKLYPFFTKNAKSDLVLSIFFAVILGITFAYFANNDKIHKILRKIGLTRETSYASEWFGAFLNNITYVVLHLDDERRLFGWPIEWPTEPNKGHFVLTDASWLTEDNKEIFLKNVENIMIDSKNVKFVEFIKKPKEDKIKWVKKNLIHHPQEQQSVIQKEQ